MCVVLSRMDRKFAAVCELCERMEAKVVYIVLLQCVVVYSYDKLCNWLVTMERAICC